MERKMTANTQDKSKLNALKETLAPATAALTSLSDIEVPAAAREFVKRAAGAAKDRAADAEARAEKATAAIESAATNSVVEIAKVSRTIQRALYQDAEALCAGVDKLATAKSLREALQIQLDYVGASSETAATRVKAIAEYFGKFLANSQKMTKESLSKVASLDSKAA
jgi:hypothetical protein